MIKYNAKTINDWYYDTSDLVKVYKGGAVCYYKVSGTPPSPTSQTPCFAVVDDISQYQETEFEDVFNNVDGKWYKLNNLNQYEEYGVYGSGRTGVTTYEGKLTIDDYTQPSRLPSGYTEVEYIENTGTSYINTNVALYSSSSNSFILKGKIAPQFTQGAGDNQTFINSESVSSPYYGFSWRFNSNGGFKFDVNPSGSVTLSADTLSDGASAFTITASQVGATDNVPLGLFCSYNTSSYTSPYRPSKGKLYSLEITLNNEIVRNYVPAKRDSDDKYGLYDLVTDTFYVSPNGNNFVGGSEVNPPTTTCEFIYSGNSWSNLGEVSGSSRVPSGYTEVEYLENIQGRYAMIDTGFKPNQDTRVVCEMQNVTSNTASRYIGAGHWNWENGDIGWQFDYEYNYNGTLKISWGSTKGWITYSSFNGDYNKHKYDWNKNNFYRDEVLCGSVTYQNFQCGSNLGIFNKISSGQTMQSSEHFWGKLYSFQLYDNGALIRDLVPCKRDHDNMYGVYDIVNDQFYYSNTISAYTNNTFYEFSGGSATTQVVYPMYYDEKSAPPNNLSFSSMTEAEEYECPWVGMKATIDGDSYIFSGDSISGYEWVYQASRLPQGYTEVEYVENQNNAYINTLFKPNQDTRIVAEMQCVTSTNSVMHFGAGGWDRVDGMWLTYETGINGTLHVAWLGKTTWSTYGKGDYNKHTYDWNKNELYKDGTLVGSSTYGTYQSKNNLAIFANLQGEENEYVGGIYMKGKMYSFKIYDNGTLVRDLVPCINPNNVVGVFDIVNDVFYGSASNYPLVAGNPI